MQYAKIKLADRLGLNYQEIGDELESEFERLGFDIELSTSADWGYVFRIKNNGQIFNISVIPLSIENFGIAIEPHRGLFSNIAFYFKNPEIGRVKAWVEKILTTNVGANNIEWYSADEWTANFSNSFWNDLHK